jgi:hypothetical protein
MQYRRRDLPLSSTTKTFHSMEHVMTSFSGNVLPHYSNGKTLESNFRLDWRPKARQINLFDAVSGLH